MHWWTVGLAANTVITLVYLGISGFVVLPLARSNQLTKNRLGAATAAIFFTCAIHHGIQAFHLLMPSIGLGGDQGSQMRSAWGWELASWDVVAAVVAACYFGLRRTYGSLLQGAQLFDDLRRRERQALEINDNVLQGLVVAKMALELDQRERAAAALDTSISAASQMISGLLATEDRPVSAGLLRTSAAVLEPTGAGPAATSVPHPPARPS